MNNITLSKNYVPVLDEVYKNAETSSVLNSPEKDIKMGQKAGEFLIAKYSMDGLKDYSRNSGYKKGNVKLDWETHKANSPASFPKASSADSSLSIVSISNFTPRS